MSLLDVGPAAGELLGCQHPRVRNVPPYMQTLGEEFSDLAASAGLLLDPWQRLAVDDITGLDAQGMWVCRECAILVARQNGKGGILECLELGWLFLTGEELVLHSAHEFKTASEAFLRLDELIMGAEHLSSQVSKRRTAHGEEGFELRPVPTLIMSSDVAGVRVGRPRRLRFVARSKSSGRGFTGRKVVFDEAQQLPQRAIRALGPTMRAVKNPQIIYTFTVPDEQNDAEHITSVRDRGRLGEDPQLGWLEWSPEGSDTAEGTKQIDRSDPRVWAAANPSLGIRISPESVVADLRMMASDLGGFDRELLSVWPKIEANEDRLIPESKWDVLADETSAPLDPVCFAVDMNPLRTHAAIGLVGAREDGLTHYEVAERGEGAWWVAAWLVERCARWKPAHVVVDASGPAGSLIPELKRAGITVTSLTGAEYAAACGVVYDEIATGTARHLGQEELSEAVANAAKRSIGNAWGWDRRDPSVDIASLVAVTLARHGHGLAPTRKRSVYEDRGIATA